MVEDACCFCITIWLPRCRTWTNPYCAKISHISRPERTRNLGNGHPYLRNKDFGMKSGLDFTGIGNFKEEFNGFC